MVSITPLLLVTILVFVHGKILVLAQHSKNTKTRYAFYKDIYKEDVYSRRVFGGGLANLSEFPNVVALLDRYWSTRCSGAVITPFWALTAAHCVTSQLAFIKYNTQHPTSSDGVSTPIMYLFRHPNYKVVQEDEGRGMDVTLLHNDVGLIRTRDEMKVGAQLKPLSSMGQFNPTDLNGAELTILGFGRSQLATRAAGEELFAVNLKMVNCDRSSWVHCICGVGSPGQGQKGVCAGDSGGPVMYRDVQVGVTSMGPVECAVLRSRPGSGATSVFTSTYYYANLINATITDSELDLQKKRALRNSKKSFSRSVGTLRTPIYLMTISIIILQLFKYCSIN